MNEGIYLAKFQIYVSTVLFHYMLKSFTTITMPYLQRADEYYKPNWWINNWKKIRD